MGHNLFLSILPIKGQSSVDGFKEQIEVLSFSHGISQAVTSSVSNQNRTMGRPHHQDFTIAKHLDESSPEILDFCNKGLDIAKAIFTVTQQEAASAKVAPIWTVTMENAIFTSSSIGGGEGSVPVETVSMNYATIKWEFAVQTVGAEKKGTKAAGWDLTKNHPLAK
jgi:type VI secretion system secreted protein Hcp